MYLTADEEAAAILASPMSAPTARELLLPAVLSLARGLLPAVIRRLDKVDDAGICEAGGGGSAVRLVEALEGFEDRNRSREAKDGSGGSGAVSAVEPEGGGFPPGDAGSTTPKARGGLKTTGLENECRNESRDGSGSKESGSGNLEAGLAHSSTPESSKAGRRPRHPASDQQEIDREGGDDGRDEALGSPEYLPRSAALLVSTLLRQSRRLGRDESDKGGGAVSRLFDSPGLESPGEASVTKGCGEERSDEVASEVETDGGGVSPQQEQFWAFRRSETLDRVEREAEALLDSIRRDDLGRSGRRGGVSSEADGSATAVHDDSCAPEADEDGALIATGAALATGPPPDREEDDESDGEDSLDGDMERLETLAAFMRRDLESAGVCFLDGGVGSGGEFGAAMGGPDAGAEIDDEGVAARFRRWFGRGFAMEEKLVRAYMRPYDGSAGEGGQGRLADNPVLIWCVFSLFLSLSHLRVLLVRD